jgi:hypothetical protein
LGDGRKLFFLAPDLRIMIILNTQAAAKRDSGTQRQSGRDAQKRHV